MSLPLKSWFRLDDWVFDNTTIAPKDLFGFEETIDYLLDYMNTHGPFDGFLTFSQGSIALRFLYRFLYVVDPDRYAKRLQHPFPHFHISLAGPVFSYMHVDYKGSWVDEDLTFRYPLESVHLIGTKDVMYKDYMTQPELYKDPIVIYYDDGHRFPRDLSAEEFAPMKQFLERKLEEKNKE